MLSAKSWLKGATTLFLSASFSLLSFGQQAEVTNEVTSQVKPLPLEELRTFADVFNKIRVSYVDEIDDATLLKYAIRGMLSGLDPHSAFLDDEAWAELQDDTKGEFGGIGVEISEFDGLIKIIAPIDDTPAAKAGLQSGDLVVRIDQTPVRSMLVDDAIDLMRGEPGSDIELTILREGVNEAFDVQLVRDTIKVRSVRSRMIEPGLAYLRIAQFQANTGQELRDNLQQLQAEEKIRGLVIDLRNNPGGVLDAAVEVCDSFLEEGLIVYTDGREPALQTRFSASAGDIINGAPIVILINGGSASASEIVAGALQDQKRALILGTESFGKGSVQTVVPVSETKAIKLTTALYFTPAGRSIQALGIEPDLQVEYQPRKIDDTEKPKIQIKEADLRGHLDNGNGVTKKTSDNKPATEDLRDNQLYEAVNVLKAYQLLSQHVETLH